ncbi:hypothetical protein HAX54_039416, partial [Datura stramonium]|nr:hypothetical protein [Datura stramonium]
RNTANAEVSAGNNTANLPPQTRMQTRNGTCSRVLDASIDAPNAHDTNVRVPRAPIPQPSHAKTSEKESTGAI